MPPSVCLVKHRFAHAPRHSHMDLSRIWDQPILPVPMGVIDPLHWRVTALNGASLPPGAWSPHGPPPADLQGCAQWGWTLFKFFSIFKSRYNSHNIKFVILKCTIQWLFHIFTMLCSHLHTLWPDHPHHPKKKP